MATNTPQQKGRDRAVSTLNALIQILNIAKDACAIPPAQVAFGSVSVLLTMIRVRFPLFCNHQLPIHVYSGYHGQQTGLCRHRVNLRQRV